MTDENTQRLRNSAVEICALPPGWDSYKARTIDARAVERALRFCEWLKDNAPVPILVPLNDGGVQLEWHTADGQDVEIEFMVRT